MKNIRFTSLRRLGLLLLVSALALAFVGAQPAAAAESNDIKVERVNFPVSLSDGNTYNIAGYLYYHGSFRNRTLQVLVHGATYNHTYWDAPAINGRDYSYARYMADRKYAVLAIDQLGAGESSKPGGDFVTLGETVSSLHQVLRQLRQPGNPVGYAFEKIVLVGHSFGSINAVFVQAGFHDADALVTTGFGHVAHDMGIPQALIDFLLAQPAYFLLPPSVRTAFFYHLPGADPDVVAYDNSNMADTLTRGQLFSTFFVMLFFSDPADQVTGPVLVQLGEFDALWPASFASGEAGRWLSASSVTVQSLAGVGHDFNTHLNNKVGWAQIDEWVASTVGRK